MHSFIMALKPCFNKLSPFGWDFENGLGFSFWVRVCVVVHNTVIPCSSPLSSCVHIFIIEKSYVTVTVSKLYDLESTCKTTCNLHGLVVKYPEAFIYIYIYQELDRRKQSRSSCLSVVALRKATKSQPPGLEPAGIPFPVNKNLCKIRNVWRTIWGLRRASTGRPQLITDK